MLTRVRDRSWLLDITFRKFTFNRVDGRVHTGQTLVTLRHITLVGTLRAGGATSDQCYETQIPVT